MTEMRLQVFLKKADAPLPTEIDSRHISESVHWILDENLPRATSVLAEEPMSTFHHLFRVDLGGRAYYLKMSRFREFGGSLLLEAFLYEDLLREVGCAVAVVAVDATCEKVPFPYLLLEGAQGVRLRDVEIGGAGFEDVVSNLGETMARIHSAGTEVSKWGPVDTAFLEKGGLQGAFETWSDYRSFNRSAHLRYLVDKGGLDNETARRIENLFGTTDSTLGQIERGERGALLHGDLGSHNIFFDPATSRITSIVDWEDALIGDPLFDTAMFASFYRMEDFVETFLAGYGRIRPVQWEQSERTFWLYYLRIALAKGVVRFRLGYDRPGKSLAAPKIARAVENLDRLR